jgi:Helix-turn-helix domain/YhfZ C-terminal domain
MQNAALLAETSPLVSIARDLLLRQPGDRIPTVLEYQDRLGIGSGTVQARLRALVGIGAIELRARGHQGTILVDRNLSDLWTLAHLGPISGVLPLPEALEPASLAAVLRRAFQRLRIPLELLYLHGSAKRIDRQPGGHRVSRCPSSLRW